MELRYSLGAEDFLAFQMYASGESALARRRRLTGRLVAVFSLVGIGLIQLNSDRTVLAISTFVLAALLGIFYPFVSSLVHRRHFKRHVKENYQKRIGSEARLRLEEDGLISSGEDGEGMLNFSAVDELVEVETLGLIKLKAGMTLILPKAQIGEDRLREFLAELAKRTGVELSDRRGRRWR